MKAHEAYLQTKPTTFQTDSANMVTESHLPATVLLSNF